MTGVSPSKTGEEAGQVQHPSRGAYYGRGQRRRYLQNSEQPAQQRAYKSGEERQNGQNTQHNEKYQVDVNLFAEVGVNWSTGANNRFADWYSRDLEK